MSKEEISPEEPMQPPPMGGMLLTMLFMLYIIMNEDIRDGMGIFAGNILEPQIGFEHQYPASVSYTHLTLPTKRIV